MSWNRKMLRKFNRYGETVAKTDSGNAMVPIKSVRVSRKVSRKTNRTPILDTRSALQRL